MFPIVDLSKGVVPVPYYNLCSTPDGGYSPYMDSQGLLAITQRISVHNIAGHTFRKPDLIRNLSSVR
jgi:hypothetical protein